MSATVKGVPQKKGLLSEVGKQRIAAAKELRDTAEAAYREEVLAEARRGASVRMLAEFTGMSTNTIGRWKRGE